MITTYFNADVSDDRRRTLLYDGHLFVHTASSATRQLCQFARDLIEEAFDHSDPPAAQHDMPVEDYVDVLAKLKPAFIHHPVCKELLPQILRQAGCDLEQTYFDVPRLRSATSDGYLTAGLGYVFKPHRDTWYSPPQCQLNWWLPVYPVESGNVMAFHTDYWNKPLRNSSEEFDYQDWQQTGRKAAPGLVQKDTRRQSEALDPVDREPELRIVTEPGGLLIFSAAHLHSTVPNDTGRTRFSIDFRTVHLGDLRSGIGAPNHDSACGGTTIHDYLRGTDLAHLPADVVEAYETDRPDWKRADAPVASAH